MVYAQNEKETPLLSSPQFLVVLFSFQRVSKLLTRNTSLPKCKENAFLPNTTWYQALYNMALIIAATQQIPGSYPKKS